MLPCAATAANCPSIPATLDSLSKVPVMKFANPPSILDTTPITDPNIENAAVIGVIVDISLLFCAARLLNDAAAAAAALAFLTDCPVVSATVVVNLLVNDEVNFDRLELITLVAARSSCRVCSDA
jgi:hypothetical protein